jgi:hypothetical protein
MNCNITAGSKAPNKSVYLFSTELYFYCNNLTSPYTTVIRLIHKEIKKSTNMNIQTAEVKQTMISI